jgi:hypothetical protein
VGSNGIGDIEAIICTIMTELTIKCRSGSEARYSGVLIMQGYWLCVRSYRHVHFALAYVLTTVISEFDVEHLRFHVMNRTRLTDDAKFLVFLIQNSCDKRAIWELCTQHVIIILYIYIYYDKREFDQQAHTLVVATGSAYGDASDRKPSPSTSRGRNHVSQPLRRYTVSEAKKILRSRED